jgi:hypothetical protein
MVVQDWKLTRVRRNEWSLTNTSGKRARDVYVRFEGLVDGRRWWEGVTPTKGLEVIGEIWPDQTVLIKIDGSDTVDKVSVRWRSGFRSRTWETTKV